MQENKNDTPLGGGINGFDEALAYTLRIVPGIVRTMSAPEREREQQKKEQREKKYKSMHIGLKGLFERYRESETGGFLCKVVDVLLSVDIKCAPPNDDSFRKRHNAVVLRYITEKPITDKEICKRLGIPTWLLEDRIDIAIGDMMLSFYGVEILDVMT